MQPPECEQNSTSPAKGAKTIKFKTINLCKPFETLTVRRNIVVGFKETLANILDDFLKFLLNQCSKVSHLFVKAEIYPFLLKPFCIRFFVIWWTFEHQMKNGEHMKHAFLLFQNKRLSVHTSFPCTQQK